jgi:hypothetical protein
LKLIHEITPELFLAMKKNKRHGTGLPRRMLACPVCGGKLKVVKDAVFKQECKGEKLVVKSPASLCAHCDRQFICEGQGDQLRRNTADEYRRRHDLLSSLGLLRDEWVNLHRESGFEALLTGNLALFRSSKTCCNE